MLFVLNTVLLEPGVDKLARSTSLYHSRQYGIVYLNRA